MQMPPFADTTTVEEIKAWIYAQHGADGARFLPRIVLDEGPTVTAIRALKDSTPVTNRETLPLLPGGLISYHTGGLRECCRHGRLANPSTLALEDYVMLDIARDLLLNKVVLRIVLAFCGH